jgi:hydrogenase-4 component A
VCSSDAIRRDPDGNVRVDEKNCVGCKLCSIACPYGAIHLGGTPITGVVGMEYSTPTFVGSLSPILQWKIGVYSCAVKCDLCVGDPSGSPQCVTYCVTKALRLVEPTDASDKTGKEQK